MSPPRVLARARWRYFRHPGTDTATLSATERGYRLSGAAHVRFPEEPTRFRYVIACDPAWRPRAAEVELHRGRERHTLRIEIGEGAEWTVDGFRRPELRGFTDVDLSASPSTNTLALRRLNLPIGGVGEIDMGWIVFPDLEIRPVRQRYGRLSDRHYRYEGLHNRFVAEFDVDREGLVTEYPEFWTRLPLLPARNATRGSSRTRRTSRRRRPSGRA